MLSETYQQAASIAPTPTGVQPTGVQPAEQVDTQNLYTHFTRRRLSAEEIRDSILAISGDLDREPGKDHPFPSPVSWGYTQHGPFSAVYDHNKRSIYLMTQRLKRHPFLALFDGADPNASTADRLGTTVPTQALYFLNDPFIYAKSEAWARRLVEQHDVSAKQINSAYEAVFARTATAEEQIFASEFVDAYKAELATVAKDNLEVASLAALLRNTFCKQRIFVC